MSESEPKDRWVKIGEAVVVSIGILVFLYILEESQPDYRTKIREWDLNPRFKVDQEASNWATANRSPNRSNSLNPNKSNPLGIKSNPLLWESLRSSFAQQKTERYWKVAVADLHDLRFGLATEVEEDEPPLRALHNIQTAYESKLHFVRVMSIGQVDQDLLKMVEKHSAMDREFLEFVSRMQEELKKMGFSEEYSPPRAQVERGLKILTELQSDPSLLEKLPPKEQDLARISLTMAESLNRQLESAAEQYHDIELMQARLEGRFPEGDFSLPDLPEIEE